MVECAGEVGKPRVYISLKHMVGELEVKVKKTILITVENFYRVKEFLLDHFTYSVDNSGRVITTVIEDFLTVIQNFLSQEKDLQVTFIKKVSSSLENFICEIYSYCPIEGVRFLDLKSNCLLR